MQQLGVAQLCLTAASLVTMLCTLRLCTAGEMLSKWMVGHKMGKATNMDETRGIFVVRGASYTEPRHLAMWLGYHACAYLPALELECLGPSILIADTYLFFSCIFYSVVVTYETPSRRASMGVCLSRHGARLACSRKGTAAG